MVKVGGLIGRQARQFVFDGSPHRTGRIDTDLIGDQGVHEDLPDLLRRPGWTTRRAGL
jgi:hypothetical protein